MSAKKFLIVVGVFSSSLILLVSALFYMIDPLFLYRESKLYEPQYIATERYQMPGLIKTQNYHTLFTGTSMGRNFEESYVDEKLATKSFNASLPASTAKEQSMVADLALRSQERIDRVFWELNFYSFSGDPDWVTKGGSDFPKYMYDQSKLNDFRYLFNSYTFEIMMKNLYANEKNLRNKRNIETLYKFGKGFPKEDFDRINNAIAKVEKRATLPDYETADTMLRSFDENVISLVKNNPDTTFTFFFAPYSVYNQYIYYERHPDYLKERAKFKREAYKRLSQYPNAQLYDFQVIKQITFNIDNYMGDGVHYYNHINRWMIDYMSENVPIRNLAKYEYLINHYIELVENFTPEQLRHHKQLIEKYQL
ncbi:hypothetical protein [Pseudoneobacillus sp. C159]